MSLTKNTLLVSAFILILSCIHAQQTITTSIMHDGIERDYIIYIPDSYNESENVPLLLNFHGYGSNASQQLFYGDFRSIADREGFIIAHPDGTVDLAGNTHWNVGWGTSTIDDVSFISALIDHLLTEYSIDEERIYSTGMSNGGFISYELACQLSDRIAAIASVTGSMSLLTYDNCNPERPVPVLQIHGTNDNTVLYEGSAISVSIDLVMEYWVEQNKCNVDPVVTAIDDVDMTDQSTVEHYVWGNGDMGVTTELYLVENGGHTWPGAIFNIPVTNYDINGSEEVWKFLSRYDINGEIQLSAANESIFQYDVSIAPNPSIDFVQLCWHEVNNSSLDVVVCNTNGKIMLSHSNVINCDKIDLSQLSSGLYFMKIRDKMNGKSISKKLIKI